MSQLQQLKLFVNERLAAAAEEIFGAVERTILEYQNDIYLSKGDKHSTLLTLAEGLKQEEGEVLTAVSQEVSMSEAEASKQPSHTECCQVLVKQETSGPGFTDPPKHWPSQDEGTLQDLLESESVACSRYRQSTDSSSFCRSETVADGERDLLPGPSTEWIKTEDGTGGYGGSEFLQPLSSESVDGNDTSDPILNIKEQTNQSVFCCELCGQSFDFRSSLMMHVKTHTNNAAILCPSNHATSTGSDIEPQESNREDNLEDTLCNICGKTFSRKCHLRRHMLIHTGQKPHGCKECGKTFARVECLRIHMRIHTVERPYACDFCGRGFRQRSNMIYHIRIHTGEKPHCCSICSKSFANKKDMIRHMQVHTKKK